MNALTIRLIADGTLVCFGPENGRYDPQFDPTTMRKQREADYAAVLTEWQARPIVEEPKHTARRALKQVKTLPELLTLLEQLL